MGFTENYAEFLTITILEWRKLLKPDKYKDILIDSFRFLVLEKRTTIYSYCIMDNHIHIIWQPREGFTSRDNQHSFTKFTAQQIKFDLQKNHPKILSLFYVGAKDRMYQFWERNPLPILLFSPAVFKQKLDYIHNNPVKAGICNLPEDYYYSSAKSYYTGKDELGILELWRG